MFKFNLVKLEKTIIYQPVFISEDLLNKYRNYNYRDRTHNYGGFIINYCGTPELCIADKVVFLGLENIGSYFSSKKFISNKFRDEYYDELLETIKQSINYLKNLQ